MDIVLILGPCGASMTYTSRIGVAHLDHSLPALAVGALGSGSDPPAPQPAATARQIPTRIFSPLEAPVKTSQNRSRISIYLLNVGRALLGQPPQ